MTNLLSRSLYKQKQMSGFTLIEVLIYSGLLVIISTLVVSFLVQIVNLSETSRRSGEELDNAQKTMDVIEQEVRHALSIYTPTSVFDNDAGQLSLETTRDLPADENSTYVDFYLDGGGVFLKREGEPTQLITGEKINVTKLRFTNLSSGTSAAVKITLTAQFKEPISFGSKPVTLESTASLRSY